ncbi:MAG: hypothetical protein ACKOPS_18825, partial [Cyanobium sp.]
KRNEHLLDYKSECGSRSLLEAGNAGEIAMLPADLYNLPIKRKLLNHDPSAHSLMLMIDNPFLVPDLPSAPSSQTPTFTARSLA